MIVVVFRIRLKPGLESEYDQRLGEMMKLASEEAEGLLGIEEYRSDEGELAYVIEWENEESLAAWRDHPTHQIAMGEGREKFFASYRLQICEQQRRSDFP